MDADEHLSYEATATVLKCEQRHQEHRRLAAPSLMETTQS
jgi:hypothetical protein